MKYYKILSKELKHHGFQYVENALNVDTVEFNPSGDCEPGGLYFAREDIFCFLYSGDYICEVTIPEDARVYENPNSPKKWKADKIILGQKKIIDMEFLKSLIEDGAIIDARYLNDILLYFTRFNNLDAIKYLQKSGYNIAGYGYDSLQLAAMCGKTEIFRYIMSHGFNQDNKNYLLAIASEHGHLDIVKICVENGADINSHYKMPIARAIFAGHVEIVKYLIEQGASLKSGLIFAVQSREVAMVEFILRNFDIWIDDYESALKIAIDQKLEDIVVVLKSNYNHCHNLPIQD